MFSNETRISDKAQLEIRKKRKDVHDLVGLVYAHYSFVFASIQPPKEENRELTRARDEATQFNDHQNTKEKRKEKAKKTKKKKTFQRFRLKKQERTDGVSEQVVLSR